MPALKNGSKVGFSRPKRGLHRFAIFPIRFLTGLLKGSLNPGRSEVKLCQIRVPHERVAFANDLPLALLKVAFVDQSTDYGGIG
jgi:hypothetical protein